MFVEHGLGPWPRRLAPDEALDYVRDRDTLVVTRMGRLSAEPTADRGHA